MSMVVMMSGVGDDGIVRVMGTGTGEVVRWYLIVVVEEVRMRVKWL